MERSKRCLRQKLSHPICGMFHSSNPSGLHCRGRKVELLHKNPSIYLVHNFLTESELQHFDTLITSNESKFTSSFTEGQNQDEDEIYSNERTSTFVYLGRGQDRAVREVEGRVSGLLSLPSTHIEPLQIVRYTAGQQFTLHHDAGTLILKEDGNEEEEGMSERNGVEQRGAIDKTDSPKHDAENVEEDADDVWDGNKDTNNTDDVVDIPADAMEVAMQDVNGVLTADPGTSDASDADDLALSGVKDAADMNTYEMVTVRFEDHDNSRDFNQYTSEHGSPIADEHGDTVDEAAVEQVEGQPEAAEHIEEQAEKTIVEQAVECADEPLEGEAGEYDASTSDEDTSCNTSKPLTGLDGHVDLIPPYRLFTIFVYLTSLPPLMGCTAFPALGLRVTPTRGAALVFCNLMPDGVGDVRVSHGGEGVPSPLVKYGMNIWVCSDPLASDLGLVEGSIGAKGGGEGKKGKGNKEEDGHCGKGSGKGLSALERAEVETRVHMRMRMGCVDMKEEGGGEESVEGEDRAERLADLFIQQFRPDTMSVKEYRIRQGAVAEVLQERSERSEKKERSKRKVQAVKSAVVRNSIEQKNDVEADQDTEDVACKKRKETNIAP